MANLCYRFRWLLDILLWPLDAAPAWIALPLISVVTGWFATWVFRRVTRTERLALAREQMAAAIYEIWLFQRSARRMFFAQANLMRWAATYIFLSAPAAAVLSLPFWLLFLHLDARYGLEPLPVRSPILVDVTFDQGESRPAIDLSGLPSDISLTAPPLYIEDERRLVLGIQVGRPAVFSLPLRVGNRLVTKELDADPLMKRVSLERVSGSAVLFSPGLESPIADADGVASIRVRHTRRVDHWFGLAVPWWLVFVAISLTTGYVAQRRTTHT